MRDTYAVANSLNHCRNDTMIAYGIECYLHLVLPFPFSLLLLLHTSSSSSFLIGLNTVNNFKIKLIAKELMPC